MMLHDNLILILVLLLGVTILVMVGQKLKISYPIFLVLAGLMIGFIPGMPHFTVDPDIIFLLFLPPLLYEAAWTTSWKDFWEYKGAIFLMAVGLVLITSVAVAYASVAFIPGFTLALGFLLGGIISPPDAIAASSVLKGIKIPKTINSLLEGESLVNDASSLIVFKFALVAVVSGHFVLQEAALNFFVVAGGGILIGLAIGGIFYALHKWLPTNDNIDTVLTLLTPYFMYIVAEHFKVSGVMAVVSGGLFLCSQSHVILTPNSRVKVNSVWSAITFMMNGVVFILIGLALPDIVADLGSEYPLQTAISYGIGISILALAVRFIWLFSTSRLTSLVNKKTRIRYQGMTWHSSVVIVWAGMRGVVSLAAALSIPLMLNSQTHFPLRNLILFITFVVILVTLVIQGLSLPYVIRLLKIPENTYKIPEQEQSAQIKLKLIDKSLIRIQQNYQFQCIHNELMANFKVELENSLKGKKDNLEAFRAGKIDKQELKAYREIMLDLIQVQRHELHLLKNDKNYDDDIIREEEKRLDLEELSSRGNLF
ncbi:CPA1 family monovalent cation:H+ antiporter [Pedobacter cryoconitis]|uniref:CPA1 family monovalent cation:H+ antiporter n=1 Tax=Pedobacter cryoconitis TaxID=188932 RepID=A0A7W8ZJJ2_9SPHI|nr:Na+/H+ antiporter [Pedobacter cryoconitis]MBB5635186.1 CPA1 family monovalent cation:H+ antiporter [Pedobacter cryoconitis]MBB6271631.1 CPA1 family monovalent cation:H+ antiporter [Pedobacter cryoconitis]